MIFSAQLRCVSVKGDHEFAFGFCRNGGLIKGSVRAATETS